MFENVCVRERKEGMFECEKESICVGYERNRVRRKRDTRKEIGVLLLMMVVDVSANRNGSILSLALTSK